MKKFYVYLDKKFVWLLAILTVYVAVCLVGMQLYDSEKAADWTTEHTMKSSHTCCAGWVMCGLWRGNCYIGLYPAWMYKYILPLYGFNVVKTKTFQKGDIIVFPSVKNHRFGHNAIYNGKQWVSDFKQRSIIVAKEYSSAEPVVFRKVSGRNPTKE